LSGCIDYFDLPATNEFVAAAAKPSIVQRFPFSESVESAQKAVGRIQSNQRRHFHQPDFVGANAARQSTASRKTDRKNPYFEARLISQTLF